MRRGTGISSLDVFNHMRYTFGSVILPSHISNWQIDMPGEDDVPFWRRLGKFYSTWKQIYHWTNVRAPMEDALARKYLGNDIPYIDDITRNMSVYLVNKHPLISISRLEQRNVIYFNGFHILKVPPALPEVYTRICVSRYFSRVWSPLSEIIVNLSLHLPGFEKVSRRRDGWIYLYQSRKWN